MVVQYPGSASETAEAQIASSGDDLRAKTRVFECDEEALYLLQAWGWETARRERGVKILPRRASVLRVGGDLHVNQSPSLLPQFPMGVTFSRAASDR